MFKSIEQAVVVIALLFIVTACQSAPDYDIRDFGATANDASSLSTQAIQKAIDQAAQAGGGIVTLSGGDYVSGSIHLKSNVTLHVAENSRLISSINPNDFEPVDPFIDATGQYRGQCFICSMGAHNIAITGKGTIDGRGEMFTPRSVKKTLARLGVKWHPPKLPAVASEKQNYVAKKIRVSNRPFLIRLVRVDGIEIRDITLRQPAAWTLHLYQSRHFNIDGISIYSHANRNNDGIDIDSSENGTIRNVTIDSGDDAICFKGTSTQPARNVHVSQCTLSSEWGAIKFGTESMGDFKDITVENCKIHDTRGGGIKILSVDGARIENVQIKNIEMTNVEMPIFMRLGERGLVYHDAERLPVGSINNVLLSNITATTPLNSEARLTPGSGIFITGTPHHKIGEVTLKDIHIELDGGGTAAHRNIQVPENIDKYPEFIFFGAVPAYGLFARHVEQLNTSNVSFNLRNPDERKEKLLLDINQHQEAKHK